MATKSKKPISSPRQQAEQELIDALNKAFNLSDTDILSEREALECSLSVAEGWQMRLDELKDE